MSKALEILNQKLENEGVEISLTGDDGEIIINAILEGLGEDEDGAIVCEIAKMNEDEDGNIYYGFHSVIADHLEEKNFAPTMLNLNELNMALLVGAYGILKEDGTIFHKYVYKMPKMDAAVGAEILYGVFVDIVASIYNDYDAIFDAIAE